MVDVLAVRDIPPSILAVEAKSGKDIDDRQAKAYRAMQTDDVRRQSSDVPNGAVRSVYACFEASVADIRGRLEDIVVPASVLSIGTVRAAMFPAPGAEELAFDVSVPPGFPPRYIPVDEMSDDHEFRELLLPAIIGFAAKNRERVSVQSICEEAFPLWTHLGKKALSRMQDRATRVLNDLGKVEFREFFELESRGRDLADAVIRIKRTPAQFAAQGETQGWQGLSRRAEHVLRGKTRKRPEGQLTFEDLAKQEKVGETE